jgi:hypothetical protein
MKLRIILFVTALFVASHVNAATTAYFVTGAYYQSGASPGYFNNVTVNNIYIDPSITNWIAWHDLTTPDVVGEQEWVGDYGNWLGVDDWFYITITDPNGVSTTRTRMDYNNSMGTASGTQAVIFGDAATAPNVWRSDLYSNVQHIDEAGLFNSWFSGRVAGNYTFTFELYNGYSGSEGNPDMYVLVNSSPVPIPPALLLFGSGLIGLASTRFRCKKKA